MRRTIKKKLEAEICNKKLEAEICRMDKVKEEAFAIVTDPDNPDTWKLPHHTKDIMRAHGRLDIEKSVDWDLMAAAVASLSRGGYRGERVQASAEDIIKAARHLARHYEDAGKSVPDTLGALV